MKTNFITILFFSIFIFVALKCEKKHNTLEPNGAVSAIFETEPVGSSEDTADDPCVWVHPTDPSLSIIIGTDKDENSPGLRVYDMSGKQIYFTTNEKANNVDIRYGMVLAGKKTDIITAGLRVSNTLGVYKVNPESRTLTSISARAIKLGIEVYGSCMYKDVSTNIFYAIVNDKKGNVEQYKLFDNGSGLVDAELVRTLKLGGQLEGCVADDILGNLYIGEEEHGIWKYDASPSGSDNGILIDTMGPHIAPDVEGLTIYYANESSGYLIASSQGDDTYVIYTREGQNKFIGRFSVVDNNTIDGTSSTDGIDVCNMSLGGQLSNGAFIVQDDVNDIGNQNFKIISWNDIASLFNPPLAVNNEWDIR